MRWSWTALFAFALFAPLALSSTGCASVFRSGSQQVHVETDPAGADVFRGGRVVGKTPTDMEIERSGTTSMHLEKQGFSEHRGLVKKSINTGWLVADIITCVIPVLLCVPLFVDAITGSWMDVEKRYDAKLKPLPATPTPPPQGPTVVQGPTPTAPPKPSVDMSESEKKATARAAYIEGVQLQEKGDLAGAIARFEAAEQLYSAPTHLLHLAQCHAASGKLVEAQEDYEKLSRVTLEKNAPDVFRQAVEEGKVALPKIKARVPTLRIAITPPPNQLSGLVVKINGKQAPNEILGIARPVNPGPYAITVWAAGYKEGTSQLEVPEGSAKSVELRLAK